jgi:hypothetical protein
LDPTIIEKKEFLLMGFSDNEPIKQKKEFLISIFFYGTKERVSHQSKRENKVCQALTFLKKSANYTKTTEPKPQKKSLS